uniref:Uncharacterized protein n=1 Tax=Acidiphilium symbioticum TaxID=94005 RepID=Q9REI4_9PROT|nr:hypothetical protein [Acidiphilium symbioticum]
MVQRCHRLLQAIFHLGTTFHRLRRVSVC